MTGVTQPFSLPQKLPAALARVHHYWSGLRRGENPMPFSDDLNPSALADLSNTLMLMDVFEPVRFRFSLIGRDILAGLDPNIVGRFADEFEPRQPLNYFLAQASTTVEAKAPTFYHCDPINEKGHQSPGYSRLILPAWGNGQINMLLGAVI